MDSSLTVRGISERGDDLRSVQGLLEEYSNSLDDDRWISQENIREQIDSLLENFTGDSGSAFLALHESEPVGCVLMENYNDRITELKRLFVREEVRGLGIGRSLCERVLETARDQGFEMLRLVTTPDMPEARELYESMGFTETEPFHDYGNEFIYMTRKIHPENS